MTQPDINPVNEANTEGSGPPHPAAMFAQQSKAAEARGAREWCRQGFEWLNEFLNHHCRRKVNRLRHCTEKEEARCPCVEAGDGTPRCVEAGLPDLAPCISISWGDSRCDCMETNDTEVLCITVCNCYSDVTFRGLTIGVVYVTDSSGGPVPNLPDGSPSVQIHPLGPICFGDIGPCRDGRGTCVSREVVLITRGAVSGGYQIHVAGVCFSVSMDFMTRDCFRLELCRD